MYLTDDALADACGVRVAFSGRHGGVSAPPFESLNLGTHVGDAPEAVRGNRARLMRALGAPEGCAVLALNQVHGTRVLVARASSDARALLGEAAAGADGVAVAADAEGIAPLLCFADCVPLVLVAPDGAFAVAHAGWRGVMGRIADAALDALMGASGCRAADEVNAYIGPHIRSCCFEVANDLALAFAEEFGPCAASDDRHVDLSACLSATLARSGVAPERICDAGVCTSCSVGDFYSYRAEGGRCGRHGAVAFRERKRSR